MKTLSVDLRKIIWFYFTKHFLYFDCASFPLVNWNVQHFFLLVRKNKHWLESYEGHADGFKFQRF